jgi:glycine oxidase
VVIDEPRMSRASRVGAGIINPISGKRYSSIWNRDEILPLAMRLYAALEQKFGEQFIREVPTLRLFGSEEERTFWQAKRAPTQEFASLIEQNQIPSGVQSLFGGLEYSSWHVDTEDVVERLRTWLVSNDALFEDFFDEQSCSFSSNDVQYKHLSAKKIVFCNGWKAHKSLLWGELPLSPAKGELLTVALEGASLRTLLVQGIFLLPLPNGNVRIGATYEWDDLNEDTSEAVQIQLLQAAQALFPATMHVLHHQAGIRPAARDSKPILGLHPQRVNCAVVNGFGAKGAVYAPFAAECILACLEEGTAIPHGISLLRFAR